MNVLDLTIVYKFAKEDSGALGTSKLPVTNTQVGVPLISSVYKYSARSGPWTFYKTSILCVCATRVGGFTTNRTKKTQEHFDYFCSIFVVAEN